MRLQVKTAVASQISGFTQKLMEWGLQLGVDGVVFPADCCVIMKSCPFSLSTKPSLPRHRPKHPSLQRAVQTLGNYLPTISWSLAVLFACSVSDEPVSQGHPKHAKSSWLRLSLNTLSFSCKPVKCDLSGLHAVILNARLHKQLTSLHWCVSNSLWPLGGYWPKRVTVTTKHRMQNIYTVSPNAPLIYQLEGRGACEFLRELLWLNTKLH